MEDGVRKQNNNIRSPCSVFYRHVSLHFPPTAGVLERPTCKRARVGNKKQRQKGLRFYSISNDEPMTKAWCELIDLEMNSD